jgi:DNA-binding NtrC family response regulator
MLADLIGEHPALIRLRHSLPALGAQFAPLVIIGESGVGKSLFSAHVHRHSGHRVHPIASMNATTLDERDQRIQIFGGEPTMLTTTRRSILERPTTVVLKHIDHLRPHLQDDLAEALTTQKVHRPGSGALRFVSCRLIVTVRNSPAVLHRNGRITARLFDALRSFKRIVIPPLRKRVHDIPLLALHFLDQLRHQYLSKAIRGLKRGKHLDPSLESLLKRHRWEGNVMQLKVFMRSLVVLPYRDLLDSQEYQEVTAMITNVGEGREFSLEASMDRIEQIIIGRAIQRCDGNIRKAGQLLGLTESAIHRRKALLR